MELKRVQREAGRTLIYVTHDQEQAMRVADRMAILEHGVIAQVGTPAELHDRPGSACVARRLGAPMMNLIPAEAALLGTGPDGAAQMGVRPEDLQAAPMRMGRRGSSRSILWAAIPC